MWYSKARRYPASSCCFRCSSTPFPFRKAECRVVGLRNVANFCRILHLSAVCSILQMWNLNPKSGKNRSCQAGRYRRRGCWKNSNCCYLEVGWKYTRVFWLFSWRAGGLFQWPETPRSSSFSALSWIWRYSWKLCPCFSESCHQVTYLKINTWVFGLWNRVF